MAKLNYEVIIPTFNRPKLLDALLRQIRDCNPHKRPSRVIVVDDASTGNIQQELQDIRVKHSDTTMRVALIPLKQHHGMFPAIRAAIPHLNERRVVVCVDDIRLGTKRGRRYVYGALPNPFYTLVHYLDQVDRYCQDPEVPEHPAGVVFPFVCSSENPSTVFAADHELYGLKRGMLPLMSNARHQYDVDSLLVTGEFDFMEVPFGHWYCFALDMEHYAKTEGFDPQLDPYPYALWDYELQLRELGVSSYCSIQSVVYHRSNPYNKQAGSLSSLVFEEKRAVENANAFYTKWSHCSKRYLNRTLNPFVRNFVGGMGAETTFA